MASMSPPDRVLADIASTGETPGLFLHCCCAPCASYVLEYLSPFFTITCFFYNPNITPREEYDKRAGELRKLLDLAEFPNRVDAYFCDYDAGVFQAAAMPYIDEPEGGRRCTACFELRLRETAAGAKAGTFDYFCTTLSVSPHKDASVLNMVGAGLALEYGIGYLQADFKKRDGYKRSVELSKQYGLYRQTYCGCIV